MPQLNVAFVVQGEGRGHMTQALALASHLRSAGHRIEPVLVGRSPHRPVPTYFRERIGSELTEFEAPAQVPGADRKGLSVGRTVADAAQRAPAFLRATRTISDSTARADVIVNFLDLLTGLSRWMHNSPVPSIAIAHNYLFLHPELAHAPGPSHVRRLVLAYASATAARSVQTLALSFAAMAPDPSHALKVVPPLLRPGLDELQVSDEGFLLAYALNPGYAVELANWQSRNPTTTVHCFVEGGARALGGLGFAGSRDSALERTSSGAGSPDAPRNSAGAFNAHDLDEQTFLQMLAGCRAYVGSAGFESLCEAHYLGKPILAVPTEGQFEQTLNAWDAERCGVARSGTYEDLDGFWRSPGAPDPAAVERFRAWVASAPQRFVEAVERAAHVPAHRPG